MNEQRVQYLFAYLDRLTHLQSDGCTYDKTIDAVLTELNKQFELEVADAPVLDLVR